MHMEHLDPSKTIFEDVLLGIENVHAYETDGKWLGLDEVPRFRILLPCVDDAMTSTPGGTARLAKMDQSSTCMYLVQDRRLTSVFYMLSPIHVDESQSALSVLRVFRVMSERPIMT